VAQIDHLIQAVAEKAIGNGADFKNSQKTGSIEYLFESSDHPDSPEITSIHKGYRGFTGTTKSSGLSKVTRIKGCKAP
jgi:hypothetical protein